MYNEHLDIKARNISMIITNVDLVSLFMKDWNENFIYIYIYVLAKLLSLLYLFSIIIKRLSKWRNSTDC